MIVKFKFELEIPLKDSTCWEDVTDLENQLLRKLAEICKQSSLLAPQLKIAGTGISHDQEKIPSRKEQNR